MIKIIFIILLCLAPFTAVQAQESFPPVYQLSSDTILPLTLPKHYVTIATDNKQDFKVEELQSGSYNHLFHYLDQVDRKLLEPGIYWLHFRLKNSATKPFSITLTAKSRLSNIFTRKNNQAWTKRTSGSLLPWSKRDGLKELLQVPYELEPGEEMEVYEQQNYRHTLPRGLGVTINSYHRTIDSYYLSKHSINGNLLLCALISGILFFAAVINIKFYRIVKERFFLLFALFLLELAFLYSPLTYFLRESPVANLYIGNISLFGALFFFVHFFRYYFKTYAYYKRWDSWLKIVSLLPLLTFGLPYILSGLLSPTLEYYVLIWGSQTWLLLLDSLLITSILYLRSRSWFIGIISTLPLLVYWGLGHTYRTIYSILHDLYNIPVPGLANWLNDNNNEIDLLTVFWTASMFSSVLYQRYELLQRENLHRAVEYERLEKEKEMERTALIAQQKHELEHQVTERTRELKQSLDTLRSTQKQLVQQEKMASLGDLTAGIAHEIQNPLNFVNNFSEVSAELADEMEDAVLKSDREEIISIAANIKENLQKINHHGKRADAIVKGMLQHSRASTSQKELTDINKLTDEYLRLSYQGLRAKDQSFNATIKTDFDESIEKINIIPQDIGRVVLNLFTNAFYVVNEKKKEQPEARLNDEVGLGYEPTVTVSTKKIGNKVEIRVSDNGKGIPQKLLDKIFQPFFTTKPTGQGTGLGLSLSYDIIKAHGGELKVETAENEGAVFTVVLPAGTIE